MSFVVARSRLRAFPSKHRNLNRSVLLGLVLVLLALVSLAGCAQPAQSTNVPSATATAVTASSPVASPTAVPASATTPVPSPSPAPTATVALAATATPVATNTPAGYSVAVLLNGKQVASLTVDDLAKLPQVKMTVAGTEESGPTLLSALGLAGIKDFSQVTAYGYTKGRLATAEFTLQRADVTDGVMLALVNRGTVKLTGTAIGAQKAIIDLNKLAVQ